MRKNIHFKSLGGIPVKIIWKPMKKEDGRATFQEIEIRINPELTGKELALTLVHEITHSFWPEKTEKEVNKFSKTVIKVLRELELLF